MTALIILGVICVMALATTAFMSWTTSRSHGSLAEANRRLLNAVLSSSAREFQAQESAHMLTEARSANTRDRIDADIHRHMEAMGDVPVEQVGE